MSTEISDQEIEVENRNMEIYKFNKTLSERFEELKRVLASFIYDKDDTISTSIIHSLWVNFAECAIEPTGWTALWRVSRVTCNQLKIRYPTIFYGMVENVMYKELKCYFKVIAVDNDDINLTDLHEVPLSELYPTIEQENAEVNTSTTADGLDQIRFFYNHLWMPWDCDYDGDIGWFQKTLQYRLQFYFDIKSERIEQYLVNHTNNLLREARNLQDRREYLELDLSDVEDTDGVDNSPTKDLIKLHLRMDMIKTEIEVLQNPKTRNAYEEIKFKIRDSINPIAATNCSNEIYIVLEEGSLVDKIKYLKLAANFVDNAKNVTTCDTLQQAFNQSKNSNEIYVPSGEHKVSFQDTFKGSGRIKAICDDDGKSGNAVITTTQPQHVLMTFDGDYTLENLTFDCRNVETGILIQNGCVVLKNCKLFDDGKSSVKQGIVAIGQATAKLINCTITNFAIGITLKPKANVLLMGNSIITNCCTGIELEDGCELGLYDSIIAESKYGGIYYETNHEEVLSRKKQTYEHLIESNLKSVIVNQNFKFENNQFANIVVCNKRMANFTANEIKTGNENESSVILIDDSLTDN